MNTVPKVWPNFFIVGSIKCGTTSLYDILKKHPQVFLPEMKEPHFFLTVTPSPEKVKIRQWVPCTGRPEAYHSLYRGAESYPAIGDSSPTYLWDVNAAGRIREVNPDARSIILLRDPVTRAHSHYLMDRSLGFEPEPDFYPALQKYHRRTSNSFWEGGLYIEFGLYYAQVKRYLETFGEDQVLILLTDELHKHPVETLARVTRHLHIDPLPPAACVDAEAQNTYSKPRLSSLYHFMRQKLVKGELRRKYLPPALRAWLRTSPLLYSRNKPQIDSQSRQFLQDIYEPEISKLEALLARPLPQLRKSWTTQPPSTQERPDEVSSQISTIV